MFKKIFLIISILILLIILGSTIFLYLNLKSGKLQKFVINTVVEQVGKKDENLLEQSEIIQQAFGFVEPQYYLLLFLNNTELRPGGGFIGSYAVIKIENGQPEILKIEGTEILDGNSPQFESIPPVQLTKYLKIDSWKFRDSNWSPDFGVSAQKALELYRKENGLVASKINAVVGITPTVFENILKILGPITVDGIEFNNSNFTEKLEYEVEYGYDEKGKDFADRKEIMGNLAQEMLPKFKKDIILNWQKYYDLFESMIVQKQIMFYSLDDQIQNFLEVKKLSPQVEKTNGDYLLWVDANLGAWKTDFSLERSIEYKISPTENGGFLGEVKMNYKHVGTFNWRTTRYLSYTRLYLPIGSELIEIVGGENITAENRQSNSGVELGKEWFGTFVSIEPKTNKELIFRFYLSPTIVEQIKNGEYNLLAQKQLGALRYGLTLDLSLGNNVLDAKPAELVENWGDDKYELKTDLMVDRYFVISLKH